MNSTKPEEPIYNNDRALPLGMGYKSCWMVVEGTSQKAVMDAFLQGRKTFKNCSVNGELHA